MTRGAEHSPQMKNPNEPLAPRQTRLVLALDAECSFLWSSWGLAMNHSWNTQPLVSIWTSEPARYIHSICASAMRTGGGNPSRMGLGQRPRPMLHFVLSRPKGLDEQRKYCPRMGIRIALEANTDSHPRDNIFWVPPLSSSPRHISNSILVHIGHTK